MSIICHIPSCIQVSCRFMSYNPPNIFARAPLVLKHHTTEYAPAKTGEYPRICPRTNTFVYLRAKWRLLFMYHVSILAITKMFVILPYSKGRLSEKQQLKLTLCEWMRAELGEELKRTCSCKCLLKRKFYQGLWSLVVFRSMSLWLCWTPFLMLTSEGKCLTLWSIWSNTRPQFFYKVKLRCPLFYTSIYVGKR